jgi:hypothetical protein
MKVPTAIIGLGKIGLTYDLDESGHLKPDQVMTHCRSVWNSKFFRIEQLIDPNVDHVRQATQLFGGAGFESITEATALPSPQFVIVSVPTQLHLKTLELIAKTWSPLVYLIEKPFGGDSRQATQMASLLQTQSATVYVNYFRRYLPNFISLKSSSIFQERGRLNSVKIKGYGTLENIFSHFLDLLLFLETPSTLGLTKKLKSNSEIGMLKFKDPTSGIQYEFDGVGLFARDCEMTLKYEDLIINITANGRCLQINDLHGRTFKEFNMEKSIFNTYQSLVIEEIAKDFGTNNMNTCVEDAILIHTFLESI